MSNLNKAQLQQQYEGTRLAAAAYAVADIKTLLATNPSAHQLSAGLHSALEIHDMHKEWSRAGFDLSGSYRVPALEIFQIHFTKWLTAIWVHQVGVGKRLIFVLSALLLTGGGTLAHAYELLSPQAPCALTPQQQQNPDVVIKDALENLLFNGNANCVRIPDVQEKSYYKNIERYPKEARKKYITKPYESERFFFREYRIMSKRSGPLVDGRPTMLYQVELLYVLMHLYETQDLGTGEQPAGQVIKPLCEKAVVEVAVGDTPWGWHTLPNPDIGNNLERELQKLREQMATRFKNNRHVKAELQITINQYARLAALCRAQL